MNLIRANRPKYKFTDLHDEMNKMMQDFIDNLNIIEPLKGSTDLALKPAMEINEIDGRYEVKAQLPGVDKNNIDVEVDNESITIRAESKQKIDEKNETTHRSEFKYGKIYRSLRLPTEVDSSQASAEYKNGVLTVSIPKTADQIKKGTKLEIKD